MKTGVAITVIKKEVKKGNKIVVSILKSILQNSMNSSNYKK